MLTIKREDMSEWIDICNKFCRQLNWIPLFINEYGLGAKAKDGEVIFVSVYEFQNLTEELGIEEKGEEYEEV